MPEGPRTALDRMHRAEDRVDRLAVVGALAAGGKAGFGRFERFLAFDEEDLLDVVFGHAAIPSITT